MATASSSLAPPAVSISGITSIPPESDNLGGLSSSSSSSTVTITIQPQTRELVLSDSEISVLDLGPSINEQASRSDKAKAENNKKRAESKRTNSSGTSIFVFKKETKSDSKNDERDHAKEPDVYEQPSRPTNSRQSSGSSTRKRAYVARAIRTISSPLLSPLKYSMGRPGVHRAKTSFQTEG